MMFRRKFGLMPGLAEACTPYAAERHWDPPGLSRPKSRWRVA